MPYADKLSTVTRSPILDFLGKRVRVSIVVALSATACLASSAAISMPTPVAAPADTWFEVRFVSTKTGPRVCPPGVPLSNSLVHLCEKKATPMTPREYFIKACPTATLLSVMPYSMRTFGYIVFGYTEDHSSCELPAEARRP
jgi:hypothetical protein